MPNFDHYKLIKGSANNTPYEDPIKGSNGTAVINRVNSLIDAIQIEFNSVYNFIETNDNLLQTLTFPSPDTNEAEDKDLDITGRLLVDGKIIGADSLCIFGPVSVGHLDVNGSIVATGGLHSLVGPTRMGGNLYADYDFIVAGVSTLQDDLVVAGDIQIGGLLRIDDDLYVDKNVDIIGDLSISGVVNASNLYTKNEVHDLLAKYEGSVTIPSADETRKGLIQIATNAEVITGTSTGKAVTPSRLNARFSSPPPLGDDIPSSGSFTSLTTSGPTHLNNLTSLGGIKYHVNEVIKDYTIGEEDYIVQVDSSKGPVTLTLPVASIAGIGRMYIIIDGTGNSHENNITLAAESTQTINGQASIIVNYWYGVASVYCTGTQWLLLNTPHHIEFA